MNISYIFLSILFSFGYSIVLEIVSVFFWEKRWEKREIIFCVQYWYRGLRVFLSGLFGSLLAISYDSPVSGIAFVGFAWLVFTVIDTDFKSKKIPREPCWTVFLISTIVALSTVYTIDNAIYGLGSALIFGGAFFVVAMISRGGLGSGDVRLIIALSPMGWWLGFYPIMVGLMVAFVIQLSAHLWLFIFNREPGVKRLLPFGPALGVGLLSAQMWFSLNSDFLVL